VFHGRGGYPHGVLERIGTRTAVTDDGDTLYPEERRAAVLRIVEVPEDFPNILPFQNVGSLLPHQAQDEPGDRFIELEDDIPYKSIADDYVELAQLAVSRR
jgi:hypothetical protein